MPYSTKRKAIGAEEPLSCPFGQGGAGKKTPTNPQTLQDLPPHLSTGLGQSGDCFTAGTGGAVLLRHSHVVLQHNASTLLKVTVEGRTISFLNLLLYPNWHALSVCSSIMPMIKNLGREKIKSLMNLLFKNNFKVFKIQGDLCLWHSLAPKFFL